MPACIFYLIADKNCTEHGRLAFHFDPIRRPHTFFQTEPPHLLIRPWTTTWFVAESSGYLSGQFTEEATCI